MSDIALYDTTLRDGAQTEGISYSVQDKLRITRKLDALGLPYIEGGWPGSNPKDLDYFRQAKRLRLRASQVVAFGSTRHAKYAAGQDPNLRALVAAGTPVITIFGKTWDLHVRRVLRVPPEENLRMISDSVRYLRGKGRTVFYDAEHFFDGYKDNRAYALQTIQAATDAGADTVILCDTNGGTLPDELRAIIAEVRSAGFGPLGIHCHNDCDVAVANSIAAVEAGCTQVQGTINGYGERCGNANLVSIIAILQGKRNYRCLPPERLAELTEVSRFVAELSNMGQRTSQPFVGVSAFAHKGGIHVNAVRKDPRTYEHMPPERIGNTRRILLSELGGKTSIVVQAERAALKLTKEGAQAKKLHRLLQRMEREGYHFEAAEASFELLARKQAKRFRKFFDVLIARVETEQIGDPNPVAEATVKIRVDGKEGTGVERGDGPVNALDRALRSALRHFYPNLATMRLTDYKVRVLDEKAGTAARVRVLIQSQDEHAMWGTVGVSENIIEASWQALVDSVEYKLLKDEERKLEAGG